METTNQQDSLFQSALQLSTVVIANSINNDLARRDKNSVNNRLRIDYNLCKTVSRKVDESLGIVFTQQILTTFYERIKKREPSNVKVKEGMVAARTDLLSTLEDNLLATAYGYEIALEMLSKLRALQEYQNDIQFLINFLDVKILSVEPQIFKNRAIVPMSSSFPVLSGLEAQILKDEWKQNSNQNAQYRKEAKGNYNNFIEHYIAKPDDIELLPLSEAQQVIDKFGFDTAKLHLLFAAHCMNKEKPWEGKFYLKASDIIKDLGWDKRTDLPKSKLLKKVASTAFVLSCLLVKVTWIEGINRKGQIQASCPVGRMWDILIEPHGQLNTQGTIDEPYEVLIVVRPGGWTERFLNKAGAEAREALYQFSWLSKEVLRIDPYRNELALRLTLFLTIEYRYHESGRYKIRTLLEKVLPTSEINIIHNNSRRRYDLKQQWDNVLKLLINLDWKVDYDLKTYPTWLQPENSQRKPKGYLDKFLEAIISIHPPKRDLAEPNNKNKTVTPKLTSPKVDVAGFDLRRLREAKGWSQQTLAKKLEVSQSLIARIEKGLRAIQPQMATKVKRLMTTEE